MTKGSYLSALSPTKSYSDNYCHLPTKALVFRLRCLSYSDMDFSFCQ